MVVKKEEADTETAHNEPKMVKTKAEVEAEELHAPFAAPQASTFREVMLSRLRRIFECHGGPRQYLQHWYPTKEDKAVLAESLLTMFPRCLDKQYLPDRSPPGSSDEIFVPPSNLGWEAFSSSKPAPFMCVALELLDEYLTNGFVSQHDPLKLSGKVAPPDMGEHFTLCYVKGAARSASLLVLLDQIRLSCATSIWDLFPGLASSVQAIRAVKVVVADDPVAIAFQNASLSARGSIRRAPCTLTWLGTLHLIRESQPQLDGSNIISKWNDQSTKTAQIVGAKRVSLLQLLSCDADAVDVLLAFVSRVGTDGKCFSEDCFANKRIMPGFTPKNFSPSWNGKLRVTAQSFLSMLKFLIVQFERKPKPLRRLYDKVQIEEASAQSALLHTSIAELVSDIPYDAEHAAKLDAVIRSFEDGDATLQLQLQTYVSTKNSDFTYLHLDQLRAIAAQKQDAVPA